MTKPLSIDLRERLISAVAGGMSRRSAAARFGVAASTAINWVARWRRVGHVRPGPLGGDKRSHRIEVHAGKILALVEATPDITLGEIALHLDAAHGLKVAQSSVWRLLDRRALTFKKTAHASEQERPDVLIRRQTWLETQPGLVSLLFIPTCNDRDPFHRDYFARRQGALSAVVSRTSREARRWLRAKEPGLRWHEMGSYHCRLVLFHLPQKTWNISSTPDTIFQVFCGRWNK